LYFVMGLNNMVMMFKLVDNNSNTRTN
jgi:hypothetical protein